MLPYWMQEFQDFMSNLKVFLQIMKQLPQGKISSE